MIASHVCACPFFLQHDAPVKTIHWIKAPNYSCVMTGSWDKTLKVWFLPEQMDTKCASNLCIKIFMWSENILLSSNN